MAEAIIVLEFEKILPAALFITYIICNQISHFSLMVVLTCYSITGPQQGSYGQGKSGEIVNYLGDQRLGKSQGILLFHIQYFC